MPIKVSWHDDNHTVTRLDFSGNIRMNELFDAWKQELELMHSVDYPVYSLNMFEGYHMLVGGISVSKLVGFIKDNNAPNLQMTVQVSSGATLRRMLGTIAAVMPHEVSIVSTIAEAEHLITKHGATLLKNAS